MTIDAIVQRSLSADAALLAASPESPNYSRLRVSANMWSLALDAAAQATLLAQAAEAYEASGIPDGGVGTSDDGEPSEAT